jgi:cell division protein FtsB
MDLENILYWNLALLAAVLLCVLVLAAFIMGVYLRLHESKKIQQAILSELQQLNNKLPPQR